ncbi:uncharacterized protein isoform X2 [Choristoneura fumiferana]|uniref:uncharacterized protein isoform X2 n=1 Tax=Choristoneura fumiferana TaxID=7141 RepID=UPI003D155A13
MEREIGWTLGICILIRLHGTHAKWDPGEMYFANNEKDYMGSAEKFKLFELAKEINRDINHRMRQTEGLREEHGGHLLFEIGTILGQIKEKYKRQMEMYRQMHNRFHNISSFYQPEERSFKPLHYAIVLEFIVERQLEIEQLVEILLKVPNEDLFVYTPPPQKKYIASSFARQLRTRDPRHPDEPGEFLGGPSQEAVEQVIIRMAKEERLKMKYRAEYMKRQRNNAAKR